MNYLDISLLIILGGFVLYGFWFGLIHVLGALAGLLIGAFAAARFYVLGAGLLAFVGNENLAKVLAFVLIFMAVSKITCLLFWLVDKTIKFFSVIPFMMTVNRLLGATLGLVEGVLALGFTVWFMGRFPWSESLAAAMSASVVANTLNIVGKILALSAPAALKAVETVF